MLAGPGALPELVLAAFDDRGIRTNPRMPVVDELIGLRRAACSG